MRLTHEPYSAAVSFGDVQSSNCVGYSNLTATKAYDSFGPVFKEVGTDGNTYKLSDIKVEGMDLAGGDYIQILGGSDAVPTLCAVYIDNGEGDEFTGWYEYPNAWEPSARIDDTPLPAGTAFLCNMGMCTPDTPVTFKFAGEVEHGRMITATEPYAFIANPIPVDFTLADIKVIGMDLAGGDYIQFLSGDDAVPYLCAVYIDNGEGDEFTGWYEYPNAWDPSARIDDTPVKAGQAFLGNMGMCTPDAPVSFIFPDPFAAKDAE